jgi:hypothetical protein
LAQRPRPAATGTLAATVGMPSQHLPCLARPCLCPLPFGKVGERTETTHTTRTSWLRGSAAPKLTCPDPTLPQPPRLGHPQCALCRIGRALRAPLGFSVPMRSPAPRGGAHRARHRRCLSPRSAAGERPPSTPQHLTGFTAVHADCMRLLGKRRTQPAPLLGHHLGHRLRPRRGTTQHLNRPPAPCPTPSCRAAAWQAPRAPTCRGPEFRPMQSAGRLVAPRSPPDGDRLLPIPYYCFKHVCLPLATGLRWPLTLHRMACCLPLPAPPGVLAQAMPDLQPTPSPTPPSATQLPTDHPPGAPRRAHHSHSAGAL